MKTFLIATPAPSEMLRVDLSILFPEKFLTVCPDFTEQGLETCMMVDLTVDEFVEIHENIGDVLIYRIDTTFKKCYIDSFKI